MNPVEKAIRKLDATQQRFTPTAFVFGVVKKYGDDNGGVLASNLAYSAFLSQCDVEHNTPYGRADLPEQHRPIVQTITTQTGWPRL